MRIVRSLAAQHRAGRSSPPAPSRLGGAPGRRPRTSTDVEGRVRPAGERRGRGLRRGRRGAATTRRSRRPSSCRPRSRRSSPPRRDATLAAAKQAWLTARDDYLPTEAYRFYDGPIDNPKTGPEGQINAWPLDEAYIDDVDRRPGRRASSTTRAKYPEITDATCSSRPTRRAARRTSRPAGTRSSSCSGARTPTPASPASVP